MFNNRFLKNDPLLEAVKAAQAEGNIERRAEAYVNEQFGVYSRKAVVREDLAAYDAALEEARKCMREGKPLDPVGKVDSAGDINNNGIPAKKDKSDQYLLHRRAVRSAAIGEGNDLDEAKMTTSKGVPKKYAHGLAGYHLNKMDDDIYDSDKAARKADRDQKALKSTVTKKYGKDAADHADAVANRYARKAVGHARPYHFPDDKKDTRPTREVDYEKTAAVRHGDAAARASERSGKRNIKEGSAMDPKDPSVQGSGDVTSTPAPKSMMKRDPNDPSVQGSGDVTYTSHKTRSGHVKPLNELSKKTLGSYVKKASSSALSHGAKYISSGGDVKHLRKGTNRTSGINKAVDRLTREETQLSELNRSTLVSYIRKAAKAKATPENISKRGKGMEMAGKKLDKMEESQLNELSRKTLGSYAKKASAKASDANYGLGMSDANPATRHIPELVRKAKNRDQGVQRAISKLTKEDQSFKSAQVAESNKLGLGKSVNEQSMFNKSAEDWAAGHTKGGKFDWESASADLKKMRSHNADLASKATDMQKKLGDMQKKHGDLNKQISDIRASRATPTSSSAPPVEAPIKDKISSLRGQPNPSTARTNISRGMSAAGQEASKLVKTPTPYERIVSPSAPKGPGMMSTAARFGGRALSTLAGPEGIAIGAAAPYAAAAMKQSHQQGHSSFTGGHRETPTDGKSFERMRQMSQPAPTVSTSAAAKPAAAPPAAAQAKPSIKQSFSQAYRAAREAGGSKAQFTWHGKQYQAAAKKSEYVPLSQQKKVDVQTKPTVTQAEPKAQTPGPATSSSSDSAANVRRQFGSSQDLARDIASKAKPPTPVPGSAAPPVQGNRFEKSVSTPEPEKKQYPQTRIGGQMAIQDLANKAAESPATNINKDSSVDDIVKALSPKKQSVQESVQVGSNKYRIV